MKKPFLIFVTPLFLALSLICGCENSSECKLGEGPGAAPAPPKREGPSDVVPLSDDDFEEKIGKGIVLVDFYADWCPPCRMMAPFLEEFATEMKGEMTTAKLNVDDNKKTARKCGITAMPTLIVFVDGKPTKTQIGAFRSKEEIREFVATVLKEHGGKKEEETKEPDAQPSGASG